MECAYPASPVCYWTIFRANLTKKGEKMKIGKFEIEPQTLILVLTVIGAVLISIFGK